MFNSIRKLAKAAGSVALMPAAVVVDVVRLPVSASDNTHPFAATKWLAENAAQNARDALEDSDNG